MRERSSVGTEFIAQVNGYMLVPLTGQRNKGEGAHLDRQMRSHVLAMWTQCAIETPRWSSPCGHFIESYSSLDTSQPE